MTALITLTAAGADTGPFELYSDADSFVAPFESGVSKAALLGGYTSIIVPDTATIVRVKSTGSCTTFIDVPLVFPTTTTTTTAAPTTTTTTTIEPEIPCNNTVTSGGVGITESYVNLSPLGGLITFAFNAQGIVDKLEILHNGVRKSTSSMTTPNEGPFDTLYGDPVIPTTIEADAVTQFIGTSKGFVPNRQATYASETGSALVLPVGFQQLIWWEYTDTDYALNSVAQVRVTGPDGTAWDLQRLCPEITTTTTTTTLPSQSISFVVDPDDFPECHSSVTITVHTDVPALVDIIGTFNGGSNYYALTPTPGATGVIADLFDDAISAEKKYNFGIDAHKTFTASDVFTSSITATLKTPDGLTVIDTYTFTRTHDDGAHC